MICSYSLKLSPRGWPGESQLRLQQTQKNPRCAAAGIISSWLDCLDVVPAPPGAGAVIFMRFFGFSYYGQLNPHFFLVIFN